MTILPFIVMYCYYSPLVLYIDHLLEGIAIRASGPGVQAIPWKAAGWR